ncbi:cd7 antigen-like [Hoplias malabaricus]|uniref:cd7 antigen-like n=1 Tax=Hoplias malabaricus TaxID=27720 RepID=UPI003462518E
MVPPLVVVCFIVVSSASAYGNVVYIHRKTGSSVKLRCESSNDSERLKAFSLHRGPETNHEKIPEMLYLNIKSSAYILNPEDRRRISVQNELMNHSATVTITNLPQNDTNLYYCLFYKEGNSDLSYIPGRAKFFLHVEDNGEGYQDLPLEPGLGVVYDGERLVAGQPT